MRGGSNVSKHCFAFRTNFSYSTNACSIVFEKLKMKVELVKVWWKGVWQGKECVHEVEKKKTRKSVKVTTIKDEWRKKKKKRVTKGTGWNEEKLSATYGNITDRHLHILLSCIVDSISHIFLCHVRIFMENSIFEVESVLFVMSFEIYVSVLWLKL